jgi:hypothetical protein
MVINPKRILVILSVSEESLIISRQRRLEQQLRSFSRDCEIKMTAAMCEMNFNPDVLRAV